MKNLYKIFRLFCLFVLFIGLVQSVSAQVQFSGGAGGGYASAAIGAGTLVMPVDTLPTPIFDVTVYPNPLSVNSVFKAKFTGVDNGETVSVVVSNLIGSRLFIEDVKVTDGTVINLPYDRLSKGIYLITFTYNSNRITRRFNFIN